MNIESKLTMNFFSLLRNWWRKQSGSNSATSSRSPSTTVDTLTSAIPGDIHIHWHFSASSPKPAPFMWNTKGALMAEATSWHEEYPSPIQREIFEQNKLLENAICHWQFGDWESLITLDIETIASNPHRAKLVLLMGAAHHQIGDLQFARQCIQQAKEWGCHKPLISRILIAGVHNNLGKAASVLQEKERALSHFTKAIQGGIGDERLYSEVRQRAEIARIEPKVLAAVQTV